MDPWALVVEILTSLAIVAGGVKYIIDKIDSRFDRIEMRQSQMQSQLDIQFGGNGNGMRQAIDQHGEDIAFIKGSLGISQE